jgi:orotidine-5'-phosphate decarboxylase
MSEAVIVALDFESRSDATGLVGALGAETTSYKVGLQLLTGAGPAIVRELTDRGKSVFLDLKLHEIPNSVAGGVAAAGALGTSMVTVHASAGSAVLSAAAKAAEPFPGLRVIAVTVITSLGDGDLPDIGLAPSVKDQVLRLANLAMRSGCHGVVASAHEAAYLSEALPKGSLIVTPGIQLANASPTDQSRVATPEFASLSGATHIVVGRAISRAADPRQTFVEAVASFEAGRRT